MFPSIKNKNTHYDSPNKAAIVSNPEFSFSLKK